MTHRRLLTIVPMGLLLVLALGLIPVALSSFSGATSVRSNSFGAGSVGLGDDDAGAAMFSVSSLQPGSSGSQCIAVSYTGSLPAQVRLFVRSGDLTGSGPARYLTISVSEGSGGGFGSCTGFTASATDYNGTLNDFAAAATDWGSGVGSFSPAGPGQTRVYRIAYTLTGGAAAAGLAAQVQFTWAAQG